MGESLAVISALQRLHNPLASPADIEASDRFLTEFQKSPQSWQVRAPVILKSTQSSPVPWKCRSKVCLLQVFFDILSAQDSPEDVLLFAAQSLKKKVQTIETPSALGCTSPSNFVPVKLKLPSLHMLQVQRQLSSMTDSAYSELFIHITEAACRMSDHSTPAVLALAVALASLIVQWRQWGGAMEALSAFSDL